MIKNANRQKIAKVSSQRRVITPGYASTIQTDEKKQKKPLYLVMQKKWFDEIEAGRKVEEYREFSKFYISRLCDVKNGQIQSFKNYKTVILQEGYHKGARRMILEVNSISLSNYFTIHLGAILERQNF